MLTIYIDGVAYDVPDNQNLLRTCLMLGIKVPYFCWHPALHSVGSCRQCAVKQFKDENDTKGKIVMSCLTRLEDGMRVSVNDPEAVEFRAGTAEWLMVNHPHDCPICDEGGECHLQDMVVMTGHNYRRSTFRKRTYVSQELGPFVHHEMNRCIQCYRCVRFYKDYAGGEDLDVFSAHDSVFFGRSEPGTLESPFSGNLVEVCPTGVFTDKTFKKHAIRKWDLQTAPSVCTHCAVGCNTLPGERYGKLRRIRNRYNAEINGFFLCDRGRFGHEYVEGEHRLRASFLRAGEKLSESSAEDALDAAQRIADGAKRIIGIGSPRASVESNVALRSLVGEESFFAGESAGLHRLTALARTIAERGEVPTASLAQVRASDAVLVLGEDPVNTAPMVELAIRQALRSAPEREASQRLSVPRWDDKAIRVATQGRTGPLFLATPARTSLDAKASGALHLPPAGIARFAAAVAHEIDPEAPAVADIEPELADAARNAAAALSKADAPLVVSGVSCGSEEVIYAASNVARALSRSGRGVRQLLVVPQADSMGLSMLEPRSTVEAAELLKRGEADAVICLETDLHSVVSTGSVEDFLSGAQLVLIDSVRTATFDAATVVLPAATFAEGTGTLVNYEGRAQRFFRVMQPADPIRDAWRWLMALQGRPEMGYEEMVDFVAEAVPALEGIRSAALRRDGHTGMAAVPRQSARYSGRTAMYAAVDVKDHQTLPDADTPLAYTMEGDEQTTDPSVISRYWYPGWNSVQALNRFGEEARAVLLAGRELMGTSGSEADSSRQATGSGHDLESPGLAAFGSRLWKVGDGSTGGADYEGRVPAPFHPRDGELFCLPAHHIFGSEALSAMGEAVASRVPKLSIGIGPGDAEKLGLAEGATLRLGFAESAEPLSAPVAILDDLPEGTALVPAGFEGVAPDMVGWARVEGGA